MRHIKRTNTQGTWSVCGLGAPDDTFVEAAMQSDCDACRNHPSINVGCVGDVRWDGRGKLGMQPPTPEYTPQPWSVKTLEEERAERIATAAQHNAQQGSTVGSFSFTPNEEAPKKPTKRGEKK